MDQPTILVTGGTGKTGRRIAERLVQLGHPVKLASRSGEAAGGAGAARFDWNDAGTHDAALAGVARVYLVAPVGAPDPYPVMAEFIDRALPPPAQDRDPGRLNSHRRLGMRGRLR